MGADGHVMGVAVLPRGDEDSSPRLLRLRNFLSATQQQIAPNSLHPRLEYAVAPLRLVAVYISLRDRRFVGDVWVGSLPHFHFCGDLWWLWEKLVMFLVFSCLKLQNRVSSRRKKGSRGWTLESAVFAHGILGERRYRNRNRVNLKESSEGSSKKFDLPSNIANKGGMTIWRWRRRG